VLEMAAQDSAVLAQLPTGLGIGANEDFNQSQKL